MGVSTDGQLSFGIDIGEHGERFGIPAWDDSGYEEFQEWYMAEIHDIDYNKIDDYGDYLDAIRPHKDNMICELVWHCSYDYPMHILAVKSTYNSRGYPTEITEEFMSVSEEDVERFKDFCHKYLPEYDGEDPKWLLTSMWG